MAIAIATTLGKNKTKTALTIATVFAAITAAFLMLGSRAGATPGGPTCNVPADYATIQAAVDEPGCTTIKVAPGTYVGNVNIPRSVNLKGAKANVDVNSRSGSGESNIQGLITIQVANVTINGFSLTNPNQSHGILVKTAGNAAVINNNIINGVGGVGYGSNAQAIYLETGPDNVRVEGNNISNVQSGPSAKGIYIGDSTSTNPSLGIRLKDNSISGITSNRGAYGIQVNNGVNSTGYTTLKIKENNIKNLNGGWVHAIGLEGDTPNVEVTRNVISGLTAASIDKVGVWFEDNQFFFTADVTRNNLALGMSAAGIYVHPDLTNLYPTLELDGSCNFWGSWNGPGSVGTGSGSLVSAGVDYSPWLKSSKLKNDCGEKQHKDDDNHHWKHYNRHDWND